MSTDTSPPAAWSNSLTWGLLISCCLVCLVPNFAHGQSANQPVVVPFKLTRWNNLAVDAVINQKEQVKLMFHLANSSVVVTEAAVPRLKSLTFDQAGQAKSWGGQSSARFSDGNSLSIGKLRWDDLRIHEDKHSGHGTDGKFGPNLFDDQVILIDFVKEQILVYPELPKLDPGYVSFNYQIRNGSMFLKASVGLGDAPKQTSDSDPDTPPTERSAAEEVRLLPVEFMIHSGYSGVALFDDQFAQQHGLGIRLKTIRERELKDSFGNVVKTKQVVLPRLKLGTIELVDVPVGIFDGAIGRQKMSITGGDLLKRFDLVLDSRRSQIHLRPNRLFQSAFFKFEGP